MVVVQKWQQIELSVVSIPADALINVNRSLPTTAQQPITSTYEPINTVIDPDAEYTPEAEHFFFIRVDQDIASGRGRVAEKPGSITSWSIATVAALKAFLSLTQAGKSGPMLQPWSLQTISDRY